MKNVYTPILYVFITTVLFSPGLQAQTLDYAKVLTGTGSQGTSDVHYGIDRKVYITGYFEESCDFDPGIPSLIKNSTGWSDGFIAKYTPDGTMLWTITIGGVQWETGESVTADINGNVYVTGYYHISPDFDPGPGVYTLPSDAITNIFIAKYNVAGALLWAIPIHGKGWDVPYDLALDPFNDIVFGGTFEDTVDFDPGPGVNQGISLGGWNGCFGRYDKNGNLLWAYVLGTPGDSYVNDVSVGADSLLYICGFIRDSVDFDPGPGTVIRTSAGIQDAYTAVYDLSGNLIKVMTFGGAGSDAVTCIRPDGDGGMFVTGYFETLVDFDPGPGVLTHTAGGGFPDFFWARYDSLGTPLWVRVAGSIGIDNVQSMDVDIAGDIVICGSFPYTIDFDPGPDSLKLTTAGGTDCYFAKYKGINGDLVWAAQIGGTWHDGAASIDTDEKGYVYLAGAFDETADFDPQAGTAMYTALEWDDAFFARYFDETLVQVDDSEIPQTNLYPNPAFDILNLEAPEAIDVFSLFALGGQRLLHIQGKGHTYMQADVSRLPAGIYVAEVICKGVSERQKVVVVR